MTDVKYTKALHRPNVSVNFLDTTSTHKQIA